MTDVGSALESTIRGIMTDATDLPRVMTELNTLLEDFGMWIIEVSGEHQVINPRVRISGAVLFRSFNRVECVAYAIQRIKTQLHDPATAWSTPQPGGNSVTITAFSEDGKTVPLQGIQTECGEDLPDLILKHAVGMPDQPLKSISIDIQFPQATDDE